MPFKDDAKYAVVWENPSDVDKIRANGQKQQGFNKKKAFCII